MKTLNVRAMVEGAILAALTAIMGVFYWMPVLSVITFFWSVPIILVGYRHGFKISIISSVVAALIVSMLMNPVMGMILLIVYALPGAAIGVMLRKKFSPYAVIFIGGLILAAATVLEFALTMDILSGRSVINIIINFGAEIDSYYNNLYNTAVKATEIYGKLGIDKETINQILEVFKTAISSARRVLPAFFVLIGVFIAYANFKVVKLILNRLGYAIEDIKKFSKWKVKEDMTAPALILTVAALSLYYIKIEWLGVINENLLVFLFTAYGILGMSVVMYFVEKIVVQYEIPKPLQVFIIVFIFFALFAGLPFIGMFDLTADIRRLNKNTIGGAK
ncbi:MAG: DUF2232 domain-containing protein [Lutisporaceae bacterium]